MVLSCTLARLQPSSILADDFHTQELRLCYTFGARAEKIKAMGPRRILDDCHNATTAKEPIHRASVAISQFHHVAS